MKQDAAKVVAAVELMGPEARENYLTAVRCASCQFLATCVEGRRIVRRPERRAELAREISP
jgi:hypothetical protein